MSDTTDYSNIIDRFLKAVPEYRNFGSNQLAYFSKTPEHGQHVVFGSITEFIVEELRSDRLGQGSAFQRALDFMENAIKSQDPQVQNLVWTSFLENLHVAGPDYERIKTHLGPNLTETLAEIERQDRDTRWKKHE